MKIKVANFFFLLLIFMPLCNRKTTKISYPEKFEGLTQLVLATETRNIAFTDTSVQKILGFKVSSAEIKVIANVTFDFYLDFQKDGYSLSFSENGESLTIDAPPLRVKKPVINSSQVTYPTRSVLINEEAEAVKKLEKLTDEFISEGEKLLKEQYVIEKCTEMLTKYLLDMCKKMGYPTKTIVVKFRKPLA